ncbi:hypothetical protein BOTBODRAFT_118239 [Botryobasidium botryosum FD-172 SS1]|uniref:Protein kinase domain-containing protein n=1 Tax=Botryobasidium botryosum (strain FD-172 SS1) TaxID=930990 RepID=A0A067MAP9_BOTB1|nr:hypothetical protein BOTBODRAFT_118239 [Botryobasidium botryosum FD-172 SS1]
MQVRLLGQGGFGDVYLGTFFGRSVVSKKLRFDYERDKYIRVPSIWRQLNHPNIIPFLGLPSIDGLPHLMSPLMQNGAADDFVKDSPNVNRVRLLVQVAQGLEYMHARNPPIIHGDLKANNILISEDGSAYLSDFGLSRAHVDPTNSIDGSSAPAPITMGYHSNFRWGAPEVILDDMCRTPASDIFSFGRLSVQVGSTPPNFRKDYDILDTLGG